MIYTNGILRLEEIPKNKDVKYTRYLSVLFPDKKEKNNY